MKASGKKPTQHSRASKNVNTGHAQLAQFKDNRLVTAQVKQLQDIANASPTYQTLQLQQIDAIQMQPDEEELMQGCFATSDAQSADALQRAEQDEEELMQGQFVKTPPSATDQIKQRKANTTGLPDTLKTGMESLSGMNLDHVNVHYNSSQPAAVQAHAYAQGSDIHLASGQEKHLPHELGHVVQQMEGRVKPTTTVGGMSVNDNAGLENEATLMGAHAMQKVTKQEGGDTEP